jgi:peptidoglycan/xylan/chitin deacetylase (PgdA/CDA1 family)
MSMSSCRESLIKAYRGLTHPLRWWQARRWQSLGQCPIVVLFYHRVADRDLTDWTMTRADFRAQIDWLQQHFELLSMDQVQERLRQGRSPRPAVAITFDDGYADNMDYALPLLAERRIPCLYYVSTQFILNQNGFPHDQALGLNLEPNSVRDLKRLMRWGIDIGSHTRSHPDMGQLFERRELEYELAGSRRDLMNLLGVPIRHFAFPYGQRINISTAAIEAARRAGYETVSGAYGGYNWMGQEPWFIQRVHGDPSLSRLQNWVTVDPRWVGVRPSPEWLAADWDGAPDVSLVDAGASAGSEPITSASDATGAIPQGSGLASVWADHELPAVDSVFPYSER